jgi:hypothetical protein
VISVGCAIPASSLVLPVDHVRSVRAEEEVLGIHAASFVAAMANMQADRNRAMLDLPCPTVCELNDALEIDLAIAGTIDTRLPDQAAGNRIAFGEMRETLLGGPMRGAVGSAPVG